MLIFIPILLFIAIWEITLSILLIPWYFRIGIPLFFKKISKINKLPEIEEINQKFSKQKWIYFLQFYSLSPNEIAFREKQFTFRFFQYPPLMRGYLVFKPKKNAVYVFGFLNWTFFFIICFLIGSVVRFNSFQEILFFVPFLIVYITQLFKFLKVGKFLRPH